MRRSKGVFVECVDHPDTCAKCVEALQRPREAALKGVWAMTWMMLAGIEDVGKIVE